MQIPGFLSTLRYRSTLNPEAGDLGCLSTINSWLLLNFETGTVQLCRSRGAGKLTALPKLCKDDGIGTALVFVMTSSDIQTASIEVFNQDLAIAAYLAQPSTTGKFPGIVVIQEIFGVNDHIRDVTERFTKAGYVAIAPAIYQRLAPGFEVGYTDADVKQGRVYKEQTKATELLGDVQAAIDYLKSLPNVKAESIGCIGFCFGGHVAYLAATLPDIKATASFYGAAIPTWCPGETDSTLSRTSQIQGTLYAFFGTADPSIPPEHVDAIEAALQQDAVPHQIFRYEGAQHGFFCDRRPSYHPTYAAQAWGEVQDLFRSTL